MAKIHYFQRYSSYENTVTNNVLQLLARIYDYSPSRASLLLTELTGTDVSIGIEINQQTRGPESVPDGAIIQRSFKILVEAKVTAGVDVNQLISHASGFSGEAQRILLLLTRQPISIAEDAMIGDRLQAKQPGVVFRNVTYERICNALDGLFLEYEHEMAALCEDFVEYCNDANLLDHSLNLMRVVPCGESHAINQRHGIYFQPSDRGYSKHAYLGIYFRKTVRCLWQIDSVFDVDLDGDQLHKQLIQGRQTDDYDQHIRAVIDEAQEQCGYRIASGHRFFCGKPIATDFHKASAHGIMGARMLKLNRFLTGPGELETPEAIANGLRGKTWE